MTWRALLLAAQASVAVCDVTVSYFTGFRSPIRAAYVVDAINVSQVQEAVLSAAAASLKVRTIGSGWSWTDYFIDGALYVRLVGGELTQYALTTEGENDGNASFTLTAGGGVLVQTLSVFLREQGLQMDARGNCMNFNASQTIGGVLATNVHHHNIRSFADVTRWVDVVLANGSVVRSSRGEELFMLTVGGGGQTGAIVRACFDVLPRGVYQRARFALFERGLRALRLWPAPEPMSRIESISGSWDKVNIPYQADAVGSMDWATESVVTKPLMDIDGLVGDTRSARLLQAGISYQEFEFFFPVSLLLPVLRHFLLQFFANPRFAHAYVIGALVLGPRYVYRSEVYFAGNGFVGRFGAASTDDFYAITMTKLPPSTQPAVAIMYRDLSVAFPGQIRVHPGKRHSVPLDDGVLPAVYALLEEYDLFGTFR
jgi:hypothetical protein